MKALDWSLPQQLMVSMVTRAPNWVGHVATCVYAVAQGQHRWLSEVIDGVTRLCFYSNEVMGSGQSS